MQAVLTRKRSGCSASAPSVEGSPVRRPPAQFGGSCQDSLALLFKAAIFRGEDGLGCGVASEIQRIPTKNSRKPSSHCFTRVRTGDAYAQAFFRSLSQNFSPAGVKSPFFARAMPTETTSLIVASVDRAIVFRSRV